MKKSIISILFLSALMFATSCSDMFDIDSSRVRYEKYHTLDVTADSVYSVTGILYDLQQIADRYVILGEVRGDLVDVNELTKASLRNLSEFNFEDANEYLDIADYYKVINDCNYLMAHMDTTLRHNNEAVMVDEYVAALSIRAWTYMQLALNYGKVPYYTNPITTEADTEEEYPEYDIKEMALELIPQLLPYLDYKLPVWSGLSAGNFVVTTELFPPIQLILGDLYLWLGDYQNAWYTYNDYITNNPDCYMNASTGSTTTRYAGLMPLGPAQVTTTAKSTNAANNSWGYTNAFSTIMGKGKEALCVVPMQNKEADGTVSEVASLFYTNDGTHQLTGSDLWYQLSLAQDYIAGSTTQAGRDDGSYTILSAKGDQRAEYLRYKYQTEENEYIAIRKFNSSSTTSASGTGSVAINNWIILYRRALVYLRAAESLNCLAAQQHDATLAMSAFGILRDGFDILFPYGDVYKKEIQPYTLGVHARGCGDVYLDTTNYVVKDEVIAKYLNKDVETLTFNDTIEYVDNRIVDELALEMTFEGNRFTDLVRFAERRGAEFLANKVASRKGSDNRDEDLYQKLLDKKNWYLPIK